MEDLVKSMVLDVSDLDMSAEQLDAIYEVLPVYRIGVHLVIKVDGNPGIETDSPAIATSKGWTVIGS